MPSEFAKYTGASVNALKFNPKGQEVIEKKQEIFKSIAEHHNSQPKEILFYGFSPLILATSNKDIFVTDINDEIKNYLTEIGIKYTYIENDKLDQHKKKFDWVVAVDEYFTFAHTEEDQVKLISQIANLTKKTLITTLRDYKNQDFKDREFSQPLAIHRGKSSKIFLEYHDYDYNDKNSWNTSVYELDSSVNQVYGPYGRRSMFFKQMAKFSIDFGAKEFYVHKNLMYKSVIKKNYEHVISISF